MKLCIWSRMASRAAICLSFSLLPSEISIKGGGEGGERETLGKYVFPTLLIGIGFLLLAGLLWQKSGAWERMILHCKQSFFIYLFFIFCQLLKRPLKEKSVVVFQVELFINSIPAAFNSVKLTVVFFFWFGQLVFVGKLTWQWYSDCRKVYKVNSGCDFSFITHVSKALEFGNMSLIVSTL